jgi:DNA repair protein RadC
MTEQEIITQALAILKSRLHKPDFLIREQSDASSYLKLKISELEYESFGVMYLNNQHGLIKLKEMFRGTINQAKVYPREIVKSALHFNAAAVILTHNHPSGRKEPSEADKNITRKLKSALKLIDVRVLDHIIVGGDDTFSFAQNGLL